MPRRLFSLMRALVYLGLAAFAIHVISSFTAGPRVESDEDVFQGSTVAAELCQYLELRDAGVEGSLDPTKYKLKGLTVVFRHGERSPIVKDDLSIYHDCGPFRDRDRRTFEDFTSILDSDEFRSFLKIDDHFKDIPLYPPRSVCSPGNLTAEGALQLSRLGVHLRRVYEKSGVMGEGVDVKVVVSPFRRTFQSAVSFLSSFLFPLKGIVDEVHIDYSNETFHCADDFCTCPPAFNWRAVYEQEHYKYYMEDASGFKEKTLGIFGNLEMTRRSLDPFNMMDVLLGRFICRRSPLPCTKEGQCVSYDLVKEMMAFTTRRGSEMFAAGNKYISARLHTAEAQAILGYVARMGDELKKDGEKRKIRIFSGHDTTLTPLMRTLRLPFVDFPRYASHLVFEIYHDERGEDYLRLVYNGNDRTAELPFCAGQNPCPMSTFSRFSRSGIFAALGFSNVTQLCNPALTPQPMNAYV